jgi:hypothetical protein
MIRRYKNGRRAMKFSYLLIAFATLLPWSGEVLGQQRSRFSTAQVRVLDARRLVIEAAGQPYNSAQDLVLTLRAPIGPRLRTAGRVQARIFSLLPGSTQPREWATFQGSAGFDPCLVFHSALIRVRTGGRQMNLGGLGLSFLNVEGGTLSPGRFLLVFEEAGESSAILRLNERDAGRYFARGLYIVVRPSIPYSAQQVRARAAAIASGTAQVNQEARRNGPELHCYRYQAAAADDPNADRLAQLACAEPGAL